MSNTLVAEGRIPARKASAGTNGGEINTGKTLKDARFWRKLWHIAAIAPASSDVDVSAGGEKTLLGGHWIEADRCCAIFTAERERRKIVGLCHTYRQLGRNAVIAAMHKAGCSEDDLCAYTPEVHCAL